MSRVHNFSPGPSALPLPALERAQRELLDFEGSGMSIMEQSHRGAVYEAVHDEALGLTRKLLGVPDDYEVLLLQGGATGQFAQVPLNLRRPDQSADFVITDVWGQKAFREAAHTGAARVAADTVAEDGRFYRVPRREEYDFDASAAYVHFTTNNTVMGTQFFETPDVGSVPLVADASSDILGVPLDVRRFGVIYAGAQKNMGPSGVTVVVIRKALVDNAREDIPFIWQYRTQRDARSLGNTAPTFNIYMLRNVLSWLDEQGGVDWAHAENLRKSALLYETLEERPEMYQLPVEKASRSIMNVTWHMPSPELETEFWKTAADAGLIGLKGHKLAGGLRASIYNSVPYEAVASLCDFLRGFRR